MARVLCVCVGNKHPVLCFLLWHSCLCLRTFLATPSESSQLAQLLVLLFLLCLELLEVLAAFLVGLGVCCVMTRAWEETATSRSKKMRLTATGCACGDCGDHACGVCCGGVCCARGVCGGVCCGSCFSSVCCDSSSVNGCGSFLLRHSVALLQQQRRQQLAVLALLCPTRPTEPKSFCGQALESEA